MIGYMALCSGKLNLAAKEAKESLDQLWNLVPLAWKTRTVTTYIKSVTSSTNKCIDLQLGRRKEPWMERNSAGTRSRNDPLASWLCLILLYLLVCC